MISLNAGHVLFRKTQGFVLQIPQSRDSMNFNVER